MGNKTSKRITARRAASFLAVLGVLVLSSGAALMATATSANAADHGPDPKIVVCKYVSTPGGELQGGGNPEIVSLNSLNHVVDDAWLADPTFPKSWGDAQGKGGGSIAIGYDGQGLGINDCPSSSEGPTQVQAGVSFVEPTCTTAPSFQGANLNGVDYAVTSGSLAAGASVTVTATAKSGFELTGDSTFSHTFTTPADCTTNQVSPPTQVSTPKHHTTKTKSSTAAVTPTVVEAGLSGATVQDMRAEQGLALMVAGMVMLVAAGGLGLRVRGGVSRI